VHIFFLYLDPNTGRRSRTPNWSRWQRSDSVSGSQRNCRWLHMAPNTKQTRCFEQGWSEQR